VFFAPKVSKKRENTTYLTIFGHYETEKKTAGVTTRRTTTTTNTTTTTTTTTTTIPWFLACQASKTWTFAFFFVPKVFQDWFNTTKMTPCGALRTSPPYQ
jgi:hypothetical protein